MPHAITKTIAWVAVLAYAAAMILEFWRPGFVVFFWNPQWLLLVAIAAAAASSFETPPTRRAWQTVVFFVILAIVSTMMVWQVFPPSGSRWLATVGIIFLMIGLFITRQYHFDSKS